MVELTLTPEEASSLLELMTDCLSDLRMEIADTDAQDYRDHLKEQEVFLKRMVALLSAGSAPP